MIESLTKQQDIPDLQFEWERRDMNPEIRTVATAAEFHREVDRGKIPGTGSVTIHAFILK